MYVMFTIRNQPLINYKILNNSRIVFKSKLVLKYVFLALSSDPLRNQPNDLQLGLSYSMKGCNVIQLMLNLTRLYN